MASAGLGSVVAELTRGADADRLLEEVKAPVDGIRAFPAGAERPAVTEMTSRRSVMRIALYGDVPERTLKELARRVATVTLTTFLGVAPLILEQDLQARFLIPMAASLGFGIIAATAVLMMIVPSLATLQMGREEVFLSSRTGGRGP